MTRTCMKNLLLALFLASVTSGGATSDLSPGNPFPLIALPSIKDGEKIEIGEQFGGKLMLHLFASW